MWYVAWPLHHWTGTGPANELCCSCACFRSGSSPRYAGRLPVSWLLSRRSHCSFFRLLSSLGREPLRQKFTPACVRVNNKTACGQLVGGPGVLTCMQASCVLTRVQALMI